MEFPRDDFSSIPIKFQQTKFIKQTTATDPIKRQWNHFIQIKSQKFQFKNNSNDKSTICILISNEII